MNFKYGDKMDFMKRHFIACSTIAQDPEINGAMSEYYGPDFEVTL